MISYSDYITQRLGCKVQKIAIDAGFSCPNRDGKLSTGGCAFCNNRTFSPPYCSPQKSVTQQINEGIDFFAHRGGAADSYLAYFQAYSSSYGKTEDLLRIYGEALSHPRVCGMIVGTRPDCIADDLLDALQNIAREKYICFDIGAESTYDATLSAINRGHTWSQTIDAVKRVAAAKIDIGLHLIMGLPGETRQMMLDEAKEVSKLPINILKLHQLQIVRGSAFENLYARQPEKFRLFEAEEYAEFCAQFVQRLRPDIAIDRFTNQSPPQWVIAPRWNIKNQEFTRLVEAKLNALQGVNASL